MDDFVILMIGIVGLAYVWCAGWDADRKIKDMIEEAEAELESRKENEQENNK